VKISLADRLTEAYCVNFGVITFDSVSESKTTDAKEPTFVAVHEESKKKSKSKAVKGKVKEEDELDLISHKSEKILKYQSKLEWKYN